MSTKKGFVRHSPSPAVEDLEMAAERLNTSVNAPKNTEKSASKFAERVPETLYSYSIKLDADLEQRVSVAAQKHRYTKKAFFLLAIERFLDQLER